MLLTGETEVLGASTYRITLGQNRGIRGEKPSVNCLAYGTSNGRSAR